MIFLLSASLVTRITGMSHWRLAVTIIIIIILGLDSAYLAF
jgi:hypothetical protein